MIPRVCPASLPPLAVSLTASVWLWVRACGFDGAGPVSVVLFLAAVGAFALRPLRRAVGADFGSLAVCVPVLSPLALGGAVGLSLASFLAGLGILLAGPVSGRLLARGGRRKRGPSFAATILACVTLTASYSAGIFPSPFSPPFALAVFASFLAVIAVSVLASRIGFPGRRRFSPVRIIEEGGLPSSGLAWAMLPFALAAVALALALPSARPPNGVWWERARLLASVLPMLLVLASLAARYRTPGRETESADFFSAGKGKARALRKPILNAGGQAPLSAKPAAFPPPPERGSTPQRPAVNGSSLARAGFRGG